VSKRRPPDLPPEPEYVSEVEARIAELRGAPLVLSTRDWERVRGWRRQGIPLPVVLRALDDALRPGSEEEYPERLPPRSLAYCERAVQQRWKAKREAWVGRDGTSTPPPRRVRTALNALARQIDAAAGKLRRGPNAALVTALRETAVTLRELARRSTGSVNPFEELAPALRGAESALQQRLRAALGDDWRRLCARERERLENRLGNMSPAAANATVEAAVLRRLRQELGVPGFDLSAVHTLVQVGTGRHRLTVRPESV
jgi:hypothetical protein